MRIALLHLELSEGPQESNIEKIELAIQCAARFGVNWVLTPEMAVQGDSFTDRNPKLAIPVQPEPALQGIIRLAKLNKLTVFLCCAEQEEGNCNLYNSCLVIGMEGELLGRQHKLHLHEEGEFWAAKGNSLHSISCQGLKTGILICADSWYIRNARLLKEQGAEILIVPAAWPPEICDPTNCWERCSTETGLVLCVCNQTGHAGQLNYDNATSVVIENGITKLLYSGMREAILLFEFDEVRRKVLSTHFTILSV